MPNYRLIGALPLTYVIIVSGALIHDKRWRLRTDLSYGMYIYAYPIQQLLIICGLAFLNPLVLAIIAAIATVPLAALSWFLVEKPALNLKSRFKRRSAASDGEPPAGDGSGFEFEPSELRHYPPKPR
jgi:peptidoglycan/LPS O-acetylase OafA/YrhL